MNKLDAHRSLLSAALAGAAALLLAGCGGDDPAPASPPSRSAPSPVPSAPNPSGQDQKQAVEAAYTQFWPRSLAIPGTPESAWRNAMAELAVDPQLSITLDAMSRNKQAGVKPYGDVTTRISRVELDGDHATLNDCQDGSRSGQADAATGDRKTVGTSQIPIRAHLVRDVADGRWKVSQLEYPGGPC
ncbi:hypothetical protein [Amycolatopsis saalfeldensis]|uniref:hypothetical protein n=1 Tax=Amycolatopsis saalfeldensis TaxID=394193 RepID=UPI00116046F9|nr:hypothetical protein [Amycolatopsis saalfeldensis]